MKLAPKVVMVGLGYIGLPTAALIASKKIKVHGVDINQRVVNTINEGKIHIIEPDLDGIVKNVVEKGILKADIKPAKADVFLIAVPTPFKNDHEPDISFVESATNLIIPYLSKGNLFVIESTSPVGTTEKMTELIFSKRPELKNEIFIAYCPERVLPGKILYELENNDRVIGGLNAKSTEKALSFYSLFVKGNLHATNARTAEMCKLVENSYRDVNIAFANELSIICERAKINVWDLINLANKHPRVKILQPGCGVGGHCIAVDPWFLVSDYKEEAKVIGMARNVNDYKADWVVDKIKKAAQKFEKTKGKKPEIACMGLAFKPDIDDLRESPALFITKTLINQGFKVIAVEPNIESYKSIKITEYEEALKKADIIAFLVAHKTFRNFINESKKIVFDFCGIHKNN